MLNQFLTLQKISRAAFAERVGISQPYLSQLEAGKRVPSLELAVRIERETDGAVLAVSWVSLLDVQRGAA